MHKYPKNIVDMGYLENKEGKETKNIRKPPQKRGISLFHGGLFTIVLL